MYWAAISLPRRPGPRPSRRSSERNLTWARIFSGSIEASAALTAGGMVWAGAMAAMESRDAARVTTERMRVWIKGNGSHSWILLLCVTSLIAFAGCDVDAVDSGRIF